jgi:hypothetical protein
MEYEVKNKQAIHAVIGYYIGLVVTFSTIPFIHEVNFLLVILFLIVPFILYNISRR